MTKVNGLLVMGVDSTLIQKEGTDLSSEEAGVGKKIADITTRAMNGELDSKQALDERVGLLKGLPESIFGKVLACIHPTGGAEKLMTELHRCGYRVAVVPGGLCETINVLVKRIGFDYAKADHSEAKDGVLTDRVLSEAVAKGVRKASLIEQAAENGLELSQTIAMGDDASGLSMIRTADIGIAFCVKPVVRKEVPHQINETDLYKATDTLDGKNQ